MRVLTNDEKQEYLATKQCHRDAWLAQALFVLSLNVAFLVGTLHPPHDNTPPWNAIFAVSFAATVVLWLWSLWHTFRARIMGLRFAETAFLFALHGAELVPLQVLIWMLFGRDN